MSVIEEGQDGAHSRFRVVCKRWWMCTVFLWVTVPAGGGCQTLYPIPPWLCHSEYAILQDTVIGQSETVLRFFYGPAQEALWSQYHSHNDN